MKVFNWFNPSHSRCKVNNFTTLTNFKLSLYYVYVYGHIKCTLSSFPSGQNLLIFFSFPSSLEINMIRWHLQKLVRFVTNNIFNFWICAFNSCSGHRQSKSNWAINSVWNYSFDSTKERAFAKITLFSAFISGVS